LSDGPLLRLGVTVAIRKPNAGPASCFHAELSQHDMSQSQNVARQPRAAEAVGSVLLRC